ncbi:class I adenylate-forming enzyme family protein [Azohydromonas lata]|uniref:Class I adenylate-forming enzyme family protein n=1 Tax=Azohydromonas lata TaxID=45677 RepID=A0ABU5IFQ1_9BURK|nr:class I adenylate-forming enzyme family protein [Azohydromonas lata]MDZ5457945.1 class I adenylate-forming enzyme family protein [Azohydromonas lata]
MFSNQNLAQLITSAAKRSPQALFGTDTVSMQLADALELARKLARQLGAAGLRRGSTVAFIGVTSEHYLILWMASQLTGLRTALINPHYPQELLRDMLVDLRPDAVAFFDDQFVAPASADWRQLDARRAWAGELTLTGVAPTPAEGDAAEWGAQCEGGEIASFMHTSGTSGRPKFCAQSHTYFIRLGRFIADSMNYTWRDVVYAPMPMFHINPLGYGVVAGLTAGASVFGTKRFSSADFWSTVKRIGATAAVLHGTPLKMLLKDTTPKDSEGHNLRCVFFASQEFLSRFSVPMGITLYGSTEAGGLCHLWQLRPGDAEPAVEGPTQYAGRCRFDMEATLSDEGEILVRQLSENTMFSGYLRDGVIDPSVDAQGWFHTGDRGRFDQYNNLVFIERLSEAIRVNGEYVPIDYVERKLETEAGLTEFALWSRPDEVSGQRPVLFVTDPNFDLARTTAVIETLPRIMRPVEILRIAALPRDTGVNKVQRRRLAGEPVLARHALA